MKHRRCCPIRLSRQISHAEATRRNSNSCPAAQPVTRHPTTKLGNTSSAELWEFKALEEQRNGEWRYLEFLQVTNLITAEIFMREIPGGTGAKQRSRPVDLPEHRY